MSGSPARHEEARVAAQAFGVHQPPTLHAVPDSRFPGHWNAVKDHLEEMASNIPAPDVIFAPRVDDAHQDHRLLGQLATTTWRNSLVLHYEIPKWDGDFRPVTHYTQFTAEQAHHKFQALHESFPSQHGHDWWEEETFLGLMRLRGIECRAPYAEGFIVGKALISLNLADSPAS